MERLTYRNEYGQARFRGNGSPVENVQRIPSLIDRLAAYEDTGLEPEEVETVKTSLMGKSVAEIKEINGVPVERIIELAEAQKEGRLVVLPCKVGDTVYRLWPCGKHGRSISEMVVKHIDIDYLPEIEFSCRKETGTGNYWFFKVPDIGKTVFVTRDEAEAALKEK